MADDILPKIAQDLIKFHKEQWRAFENQRQWLILAFITFSGVLTSSYFSGGAREAMAQLGMTPQGFLLFVVSVDIAFCILAGCADAKFSQQAEAHDQISRELLQAALQSSSGDDILKQTLASVVAPRNARTSVAALTYAGVIGTNLLIIKIFALKQSVGWWFYVATAVVVLLAAWAFLSARSYRSVHKAA